VGRIEEYIISINGVRERRTYEEVKRYDGNV